MTRMIAVGDTVLPEYLLPDIVSLTPEATPGWVELMAGGKRELRSAEHFRCRVFPRGTETLAHGLGGRGRLCRRCGTELTEKNGDAMCRVGYLNDDIVEPHRVHVVALVAKAPGECHTVSIDSSACSPLDNYDRRQGFALAFKRALHLLRHGEQLGVGRGRGDHWRWHFLGGQRKAPAVGKPTRDWLRKLIEEGRLGLPLAKGIGTVR